MIFTTLDYLASPPSDPFLTTIFDELSGNFQISIQTNFTYNSLFEIKNLILEYNGSLLRIVPFETKPQISSYKNIDGLHDKFVKGTSQFSIDRQFAYKFLSIKLIANQNGNNLEIFSPKILLDYDQLFYSMI